MTFARFALIASVALAATPALAAEYTVDKVHSYVGFKVTHMMVSSVKGEFHDYDATIDYDAAKPEKSSVQAAIKVASIDTNNQKRDDHLRSEDFFDAEKFPEIKFVSKSVKASGKNKLVVTGDLTIRDVTKEVKIPLEARGPVNNPFAPGATKVGFSGELTVNRHDYNVKWNKTMDAGGVVVGDDVTIVLEIEADSK